MPKKRGDSETAAKADRGKARVRPLHPVAEAASDADSKVELILRCASNLFARYGFDGVFMRDIATASGVTMATLYYHFSAKEELHAEVLQAHYEHFIAKLEQTWRTSSKDARRPSRILASIFDAVQDDPTLFLLIQHELHHYDPGLRLSRSQARYSMLVAFVRTAVEQYRGAPVDPYAVYPLAALITGYCELVRADPEFSGPNRTEFLARHRQSLIDLVERSFD